MPEFAVIIAAAGAGSRFGGTVPKQHQPLAGATVLERSVGCFAGQPGIAAVHVAAAPGDARAEESVARLQASMSVPLLLHPCGAAGRGQTVLNACELLAAGPAAPEWVLVHDAARPCLHPADLARLLAAVAEHGEPALLGAPMLDTVKRVEDGAVAATLDRAALCRAQTPQAAPLPELLAALRAHPEATDEAQALERAGGRPRLVLAAHPNPKITAPADLAVAAALIAAGTGV
ncbi:MAG: 2-C-methyl-D-erythritol 4-phosphate cytidylyltransferase [Ectothiorhodospiraceae bacterium AqS1]|nr:2-C-methyl-D-erythritol 4-phosphate cytidylyltransferase [Ectothiorhodospiraceae bacterium AqS1]